MKLNRAFLLYFILALQPAWGDNVFLHVGPHIINAEIASTPERRMHGLMQHDYLCADCGMLFVFPKADRYSFWMKDTPLPLSIAFLTMDGSIINILDMQPNTIDLHSANSEALYALEMNRGWFSLHGINVGDLVLGVNYAPIGH